MQPCTQEKLLDLVIEQLCKDPDFRARYLALIESESKSTAGESNDSGNSDLFPVAPAD